MSAGPSFVRRPLSPVPAFGPARRGADAHGRPVQSVAKAAARSDSEGNPWDQRFFQSFDPRIAVLDGCTAATSHKVDPVITLFALKAGVTTSTALVAWNPARQGQDSPAGRFAAQLAGALCLACDVPSVAVYLALQPAAPHAVSQAEVSGRFILALKYCLVPSLQLPLPGSYGGMLALGTYHLLLNKQAVVLPFGIPSSTALIAFGIYTLLCALAGSKEHLSGLAGMGWAWALLGPLAPV
eukprot:gene7326-biopygen1183